eukprot:NODE_427_length_7663_cov_0.258461.p6 type:complete len:171 gc:universal NODE_427_length_7663_cov_0.258461:5765-6277(+)
MKYCHDSNVQLLVGVCYLKGQGIEPDYSKAFDYFQNASVLNIPAGYYWLGYCYQYGCGCDKDNELAMKYYKLAAKSHYSVAYQQIGDLYKIDVAQAFRYYQLGAHYGSSSSFCRLGYCYQKGIGCETNLNEAIQSYTVALELGNDDGVQDTINELQRLQQKQVENDYILL